MSVNKTILLAVVTLAVFVPVFLFGAYCGVLWLATGAHP